MDSHMPIRSICPPPRSRSPTTPGMVAGEHPAADPPGPSGPGQAVVHRPPGAAPAHPTPRPARAAPGRTGRDRRGLWIQFHPHQSRREQRGHCGRGRALVPPPNHDRKHVSDSKIGAALRHLPSGYPQVNRAWMWAALLAASIAGWLHQLTATPGPAGLTGHGTRGGQAMIATLRHRLIRVPVRVIRHAGQIIVRPPPGYRAPTTGLPPPQRGPRPHTRAARRVLTRPHGPDHPEPAYPRCLSGRRTCPATEPTQLVNQRSSSKTTAWT